MTICIDIVFDRQVAGYSPDDRTSLAYVFFEAQFKDLARRLSVRPLTNFLSDEPDSLDWQIDDPVVRARLKKQLGPAQYFCPADALVSVRAILAHIRRTPLPMARPGRNLAEDLLDELIEVERSLQQANDQGARFYFKLDV